MSASRSAPRELHQAMVLAICSTSVLVSVVNVSAVSVALPAIRRDLVISATGLSWVVDAYVLVMTGFLVAAGAAADKFGRRRAFMTGLTVFALGCIACGLAPSAAGLVAGRVVQGAGATLLTPVALAIIVHAFTEPGARARAVGAFSSVAGVALVLGPSVGGVLVDTLGWRSIFAVDLPFIAAALLLARRFVPESRSPNTSAFDLPGQVLVLALIGGVVFALIEGRTLGWMSTPILSCLLLALVAMIGIVVIEPRRSAPLIDMMLFRNRMFAGAIAIATLSFMATSAFMFVIVLYLQTVRGVSASRAGLSVLPFAVLVLAGSPVAGRIIERRGTRLPFVIGGLAFTAAALGSFMVRAGSALTLVLVLYALYGLGTACLTPTMTIAALEQAPPTMAASAGAFVSVGRQLGTALGVALAGSFVQHALGRGAQAYVGAMQGVWWSTLCVGLAIIAIGVVSTRGSSPRELVSQRAGVTDHPRTLQ